MHSSYSFNNQVSSLLSLPQIVPVTGDSRDCKKGLCLQEVIVGAAVGEGRGNNTQMLRGLLMLCMGLTVVFGIDRENQAVSSLPMEIKRKVIKVKSENGGVHLDSPSREVNDEAWEDCSHRWEDRSLPVTQSGKGRDLRSWVKNGPNKYLNE